MPINTQNTRQFQHTVLDRYSIHRRDLPWRKTTDPYAIRVSEIMLQQTQVDRVIPKYLHFLELFPTIADLANTDKQTLLTTWS
jgi:A/G-specific adenine glycosylase